MGYRITPKTSAVQSSKAINYKASNLSRSIAVGYKSSKKIDVSIEGCRIETMGDEERGGGFRE
jgi:hypothetical protein